MCGFLLEAMQHINCIREPDRIDSPICASNPIFNDLKNPSRAKPFEHLCLIVLPSSLRNVERITDGILHLFRHRLKIFSR